MCSTLAASYSAATNTVFNNTGPTAARRGDERDGGDILELVGMWQWVQERQPHMCA